MRAGDIEIRIRGARFADVDGSRLLEAVAKVAALFPGTRLEKVGPTSFLLRPYVTARPQFSGFDESAVATLAGMLATSQDTADHLIFDVITSTTPKENKP